jgi:hypothetical protein
VTRPQRIKFAFASYAVSLELKCCCSFGITCAARSAIEHLCRSSEISPDRA